MKFSLFKNDKSTARDELVLALMIILCLAAGIALLALPPVFRVVGVILILFAVMFIPGLIYRLMTNDRKK